MKRELENNESDDDDESDEDDTTRQYQHVSLETDKARLDHVWRDIGRDALILKNDMQVARNYTYELSIGTGENQRNVQAAAKKVRKYKRLVNLEQLGFEQQQPDGRHKKKKAKKPQHQVR
jgi:hypothetical protein